MASRLALGRIIEWAKNTDQEELHYILHRLTAIAQERAAIVKSADALRQRKQDAREESDHSNQHD